MFYAIDFDTRRVESKSEDGDLLASYVIDNDLSLAITLVSNEDELLLELSLEEMKGIFNNLNHGYPRDYQFKSEDDGAKVLWDILEEHQEHIPTFTKALGKKLLKSADKPEKQAPASPKNSTTKPTSKPKRIRAKDLIGMSFNNTPKSPRTGSAMAVITEFINGNLGEASLEELVEEFINNYEPKKSTATIDEKYALGYIRGAFNEGYIEEGL